MEFKIKHNPLRIDMGGFSSWEIEIGDKGIISFSYEDGLPEGCNTFCEFTAAELRKLADAADELKMSRYESLIMDNRG